MILLSEWISSQNSWQRILESTKLFLPIGKLMNWVLITSRIWPSSHPSLLDGPISVQQQRLRCLIIWLSYSTKRLSAEPRRLGNHCFLPCHSLYIFFSSEVITIAEIRYSIHIPCISCLFVMLGLTHRAQLLYFPSRIYRLLQLFLETNSWSLYSRVLLACILVDWLPDLNCSQLRAWTLRSWTALPRRVMNMLVWNISIHFCIGSRSYYPECLIIIWLKLN